MLFQKNLIMIGKKAREGITHELVVRKGLSEQATLNKVESKCKTVRTGQGPTGLRQDLRLQREVSELMDCTSGRQEQV